jgi:hypothetical protein
MPGKNRSDLSGGRPVPHSCLVAGAREILLIQNRGEVNQGLRRRGHWNSAPPHSLDHFDPPGSSGPDAGYTPPGWSSDLGPRCRTLDQTEEVSSRPATQQCICSARQHGCQVPRLETRGHVTDAVNAAVLAVKGAHSKPPADLVVRNPGSEELLARHHAVSPTRDPSDRPLNR